jgi:hypothetical protein
MFDRRALWTLPLALAAICALSFALAEATRSAPRREPIEAPTAAEAAPEPEREAVAVPREPVRWILAGGGPTPELNQVQLEQDLALAQAIFAPSGAGLTLFAGGPSSMAVQVLDEEDPDRLRAELASLLDPRGGRESRYRRTTLRAHGDASATSILDALERALGAGDAPLTVYLAGHGDWGEAPVENRFLTWGADELHVGDLARVLDEGPWRRPARLVITSCFSGGFAEIAFASADPAQGAAQTPRCGFFATVWDRPAAGCDPNPDRGAQEGYGIHFLNALRSQDRESRLVALGEIDIDGDGTISLLEAHTRARIVSGSIDIPTTTSERFLREVAGSLPELRPADRAPRAGDAGRAAEIELPEERRTIEGLRARLGLADAEEARARLEQLDTDLEARGAELDEAEEALALAEEDLAAALLHRWPLLEDPWHAGFASALEANRAEIDAFLKESELAARRTAALAERDRIDEQHEQLLVESAPLERLVRALDTVELAGRLRARGGEDWERYEAFLACERGSL